MSDISRRDLTLGAAGAYAAFGLDKPITFVGLMSAIRGEADIRLPRELDGP